MVEKRVYLLLGLAGAAVTFCLVLYGPRISRQCEAAHTAANGVQEASDGMTRLLLQSHVCFVCFHC